MSREIEGFWYLATPYGGWAGNPGLSEAFAQACRQTAILIEAGVSVFCPIAHTHPVAAAGELDALNHDIWMPTDRPMMDAARGLIVCKMEGWHESKGVTEERRVFREAGKPIVYMDPGVVPESLLSDYPPDASVTAGCFSCDSVRMIDGEEVPVLGDVEFSWSGTFVPSAELLNICAPVRAFETGATRDVDEHKVQYARHLSPRVLQRFGRYMHEHRKTAAGMREPDNWKKGMDRQSYLDSMWRHLHDIWLLHSGEGEGSTDDIEEALCALLFNAMGYLYEETRNED